MQDCKMIKAAIFDMDGTLIDSEPMWKEAEKYVFEALGVKITEQYSDQTVAMTTKDVTQFWYQKFPWSGKSLNHVENEVIDHVASLIKKRGKALPGVTEAIELLLNKKIKIALATNAPERLIPVVLQKLGIEQYFCCVSSSDNELKGKPAPDVYLSTVRKLNVLPAQCIAFEDTGSGLTSAISAGMQVVVIPDRREYNDSKFNLANLKLSSLEAFTEKEYALLEQNIN